MMSKIESFLQALQRKTPTPTVTNPYLDDGVINNLRLYLEYMLEHMSADAGRRVLLVGEAPGYKGCRITGIPFSSVKVLMGTEHPLFHTIKPQLSISDDALRDMTSENTATIVWQYLVDKKTVPLFWNSFPFHPHPKIKRTKTEHLIAKKLLKE